MHGLGLQLKKCHLLLHMGAASPSHTDKTKSTPVTGCFQHFQLFSGFMVGKSSTSRMEAESVSSMTRRSMP